MRKFLLLLSAVFLFTGCNTDSEQLKIYAASSLAAPLGELISQYNEERPDVSIVLSTGGSDSLAARINSSESCDIFIPASQKQTDELIDDKIINTENVMPLLENRIVLVKNIKTKTSVTGFENANQASSIALGASGVPIGDYAREVLINTGNLEDILRNMKVREYSSAAEVTDAIVENKAEIGIVYATDVATHTDTMQAISEPPKDTLNTPVTYPLALVDTESTYAGDFIDYITTQNAVQIFEKYGFTIADDVEINYDEAATTSQESEVTSENE